MGAGVGTGLGMEGWPQRLRWCESRWAPARSHVLQDCFCHVGLRDVRGSLLSSLIKYVLKELSGRFYL
eukprot:4817463-Pyramimonas_sp.AAC.1